MALVAPYPISRVHFVNGCLVEMKPSDFIGDAGAAQRSSVNVAAMMICASFMGFPLTSSGLLNLTLICALDDVPASLAASSRAWSGAAWRFERRVAPPHPGEAAGP